MEKGSSLRPTDWNDDVKMTVMFSPFRERNLNPKGWEQKVKFWSELILRDCLDNSWSLISVSELKEKFRRKGKMPSCLQTVLQEMLRNGDLKCLTDMGSKDSGGWLSWGFKKLVQEPVGWSLRKMAWQQTTTTSNESEETYVVLEVIKKKGRELIKRHAGGVNDSHTEISEYSELRKQHTDLCPTETEFSLVLQHLQDENLVVIQAVDTNKKLVKFLHTEEKGGKKEIDQKDIHVHKIQLAKDSLKQQIKVISSEVKSLGKEALLLKEQGHKSLALSCMRKRKLAQNRADKLTGSLDTLEDILYRIKQAESNEMVLRAIEGGTAILKGITAKSTAEEVSEIMDNLADISQTQDDLSAELGINVGVDEPTASELEDELNDILHDNGTQLGALGLDNLPSVRPEDGRVATGKEFDDELEKELAEILSQDKTEKKDIASDSSLQAMLEDLQLPDVPTHSPQKDTKPKKQAFFS